MTEQQLRDALTDLTTDVPALPDLAVSVRAGRRRRRTTRAGVALAAVAAVAAGAYGFEALRADDPSRAVVADDPAAADLPAANAPGDWVPGTDVDQDLAAAVAEHLPGLPTPDDVYPSNGDTAGPLPDDQYASAEDWQVAVTVGPEQVLVLTASPAEPFGDCTGCTQRTVPGGTAYDQVYRSDGLVWRGTWLVRPDGTSSAVLDGAPGRAWTLDPTAVDALLQDPRLAVFSGAGSSGR